MSDNSSGRTLKTARAVLQVLKLMALAPDGVRTDEVARTLHKSIATAGYLLNSLCQEGFAERLGDGRYHLIEPMEDPDRHAGVGVDDLDAAVGELYSRTNERAYLATPDEPDMVISESRGRQGLPYVPGLEPHIRGEAHAVAVGKTILAHSGPDALGRYRDAHGLQAFTTTTITDTDRLTQELSEIRRQGFAVDREEFAEGFCCIAAPIFDADGELCGSLALSTTRARFDEGHQRLIPVVMAVAGAVGRRSPGAVRPPPPHPAHRSVMRAVS